MFKSIGIIGGSGQMGRMFQSQFESLGIDVYVSDETDLQAERELVFESEVIIISVPIDQNISVIRRITPLLRKDQLVSDFTSVKTKVIPELKKTDACIISSHPMFGNMPNIEKQNIVLLPVRPGKFLSKFKRLFQSLKLNVVVMDEWERHDEMMSFIQGLMHFFHIVFTQTMKSKDVDLSTLLSICSPVYQANFAFTCRILQRDPHLYTHILMDNPENLSVLNQFITQAQENIHLLKQKDEDRFIKRFLDNREFLGEHGKSFSEQSDFLVEKMKEYSDD